jgi:type II secretory pathway pseudopilin PulG
MSRAADAPVTAGDASLALAASARVADRSGSTFLVVLAMIGVFVAMAAVVTPGLVGALEFQRIDESANRLGRYDRAIGKFAVDVSSNPGTIEQLTRQIVSSDSNSCGSAYNNQQLKLDDGPWKGPYVMRVVPSNELLPLGIGTMQNRLIREPALASNRNDPGNLVIRVADVELRAARALDLRIDGAVDATAGKVRWGVVDAENFVTLDYTIPITGC